MNARYKMEPGHLFNRMWHDHDEGQGRRKTAAQMRKDYVPCHQRKGFDESKVIRLEPGKWASE